MNIALYSAYLGMRARQHTLDVIANNIANASTAGFKADHLFYRSIEASEFEALRAAAVAKASAQANVAAPTAGQTNGQVAAQPGNQTSAQVNHQAPAEQTAGLAGSVPQERVYGVLASGMTDMSAGTMRDTGRALDVALSGSGFLAVQTPRGERYTRTGSLTLDANGQLITQSGDLVLGEGGAITLPPGQVSIGEDGSISVKGQVAGRLKIVRFNDPRAALQKEGATLFAPTGTERPRQDTQTRVAQGALEMSNVNTISEMAAIMQNSREFDSLQRSITLMMNVRRAAGDIGKI
jgi:flagellar basal-body rod protein FlgF